MLYIHKGNHPELTYRGGQEPIVHLVAELRAVVAWADARQRRWAFSNRNAGTRYTDFHADLDQLDEVDWDAVHKTDFSNANVKDRKQAEFLLYESFPWELVEEIGVHNTSVRSQVLAVLHGAAHQPAVRVMPAWYY